MPEGRILIGTQGEGPGSGIWQSTIDLETGRLSAPRLAAVVERPTWLVRHPVRSVVYAVSEVGNRDGRDGRLISLSITQDGLAPLNDISACGGGPTDLALSAGATTLFVANFGGGQVSAVPLAADGSLCEIISQRLHQGAGPHRRQTKPHPHGVTPNPEGTFLLAPDMGADKLYIHQIDARECALFAQGSCATSLPAGSGPRLVRFSPDGRFAYLLTELSAQVFAFRVGQACELHPIQTLALDPPDHDGEPSAAAFAMSTDGRHLYASNRRTHSIHVFAIDTQSGRLEQVQAIDSGGERPWCASLAPDGNLLLVCNLASDKLSVFRRDPATGRLHPLEDQAGSVPMPTCAIFL